MKIKTQHVPPECDYLTNGKEYEVIEHLPGGPFKTIKDDNGAVIHIYLECSSHLNNKPWEVIDD